MSSKTKLSSRGLQAYSHCMSRWISGINRQRPTILPRFWLFSRAKGPGRKRESFCLDPLPRVDPFLCKDRATGQADATPPTDCAGAGSMNRAVTAQIPSVSPFCTRPCLFSHTRPRTPLRWRPGRPGSGRRRPPSPRTPKPPAGSDWRPPRWPRTSRRRPPAGCEGHGPAAADARRRHR